MPESIEERDGTFDEKKAYAKKEETFVSRNQTDLKPCYAEPVSSLTMAGRLNYFISFTAIRTLRTSEVLRPGYWKRSTNSAGLKST